MLDQLLQWDQDTFIYLNSLGIENFDIFWTTITNFATWIPLFVLFVVLIFKAYPKSEVYWVLGMVLLTLVLVAILTGLTKEWVARLRPSHTEAINSIIRVLKNPAGYSFFSGHSSSSFGLTMSVFLFLKKRFRWTWVFFIWPILFAISRIYVGVHYPLDILVGAIVGIFIALLVCKLYSNYGRKKGFVPNA